MSKVTSKTEIHRVKIYINDILHISIPKNGNIKIQSWYEDDSLYKIEIYCVEHLDEYWYDNKEIWKSILTELDKNI